jgi:hypothetical protein
MSSIFLFWGSNSKILKTAAASPEKGWKLAVRGSNDKMIFFLEFFDQFHLCNPKFGKKHSQRKNFGPKVS